MSQTVWAQAFPGGVADAEVQHALWRDHHGHLVALRLADGRLLWRSAQPLVPLLLGHGLAFGLALAPARVVALVLKGDSAGSERWRSEPLPWPDWAARLDAAASAMDLHAGWLDERIVLRWQLRLAYKGGAAPGPSRAKSVAAVGGCLLDVASGALDKAAAGSDSADPVAAPDAKPRPAVHRPSEDPHVLARQVLGGVQYSLLQRAVPGAQGDTLHTTLAAHDLARGLDLWQRALDEAPAKAPRALRS